MELNEYQDKAMQTCLPSSKNFSYMMLNLMGEVGEFSSKVAKAIRKEQMSIGEVPVKGEEPEWQKNKHFYNMTEEDAKPLEDGLKKEAGDILWQLSGLCTVMGWTLEEVAQMNLGKLQARKQAGTINGSGDGISGESRKAE